MYSIRTYIIVPRTVDRSYSLTGTRLGVSRAYCIDTGGGCGGQRADRGLDGRKLPVAGKSLHFIEDSNLVRETVYSSHK